MKLSDADLELMQLGLKTLEGKALVIAFHNGKSCMGVLKRASDTKILVEDAKHQFSIIDFKDIRKLKPSENFRFRDGG